MSGGTLAHVTVTRCATRSALVGTPVTLQRARQWLRPVPWYGYDVIQSLI
jgi:hypothetical protein